VTKSLRYSPYIAYSLFQEPEVVRLKVNKATSSSPASSDSAPGDIIECRDPAELVTVILASHPQKTMTMDKLSAVSIFLFYLHSYMLILFMITTTMLLLTTHFEILCCGSQEIYKQTGVPWARSYKRRFGSFTKVSIHLNSVHVCSILCCNICSMF
jgi:hypothetical protein